MDWSNSAPHLEHNVGLTGILGTEAEEPGWDEKARHIKYIGAKITGLTMIRMTKTPIMIFSLLDSATRKCLYIELKSKINNRERNITLIMKHV